MTCSLYLKIAVTSSLRLPCALFYRVPSIRARAIVGPSFPVPPQMMIWAMRSSHGRNLAPLVELYAFETLFMDFRNRSLHSRREWLEAEEEDAEPRRRWIAFGPFCRQGAVVAEALAFRIGDSMGRPGMTRWWSRGHHAPWQRVRFFFRLTTLVRTCGHLLAVGCPGGQCCEWRGPMQLSSAKAYCWPGFQSSTWPT